MVDTTTTQCTPIQPLQYQQGYTTQFPLTTKTFLQKHNENHSQHVNGPPIPRGGKSTIIDGTEENVEEKECHREDKAFFDF